jgi:hypothetical protein
MNPFRRLQLIDMIKEATAGGKILGIFASGPVKAVGGTVRKALIGAPKKGRKWHESASLGARSVSSPKYQRAEAAARRAKREKMPQNKNWVAKSKDTGLKSDLLMAERRGPGGLAGQAVKHPIIAAGVVGGAAYLVKNKKRGINIYNQQAPARQTQAAPQSRSVNWG